MFDCIIVGGGPAGLQAALILGRCLRNVVVCDSGLQRNKYSKAMHAFITRDDVPPDEFLQLAHKELLKYQTVSFKKQEVTAAKKIPDGFIVTLLNGETIQSRALLIATGVIDECPEIDGFSKYYGKNIYTCPYCDAWEHREQPILVYGKGDRGFNMAMFMYNWTKDIVLCTDGAELTKEQKEKLNSKDIKIRTQKIVKFVGDEKCFRSIVLDDGEELKRSAMFFNTPSRIRSKLLEQLGCPFDQDEGVYTYKYERTEVPGLFVAGNILREVQLVIVAAGQGAEAAFGINKYLTQISS